MKNVSALILGASALAMTPTANAAIYQPPGTYVFSGSVTVEKDLAPLQCDLQVTIVVPDDSPDAHGTFPHGDSATATAQFTGGDFGCTAIQVLGQADVIALMAGSLERLRFDGWEIIPPFSSGTCTGSITVDWFDATASASPSRMEASSPLSDSTATAGADCKIVGELEQISPSTQLQVTP